MSAPKLPKASKMNDARRTHGLWEVTSPAAPRTRPLAEHLKTDVLVIGGGFTGCSAALHVAECGRNAILLEAHDVGFGGSGRNVGLVNAGMWVMPKDIPSVLGDVFGERLLMQLGEAPAYVFDLVQRLGIDCDAVRAGTLHCAVGRKGFEDIAERSRQWSARGADVQLLDATETAQRVGSHAYSGSLLDHRAGTIQPLAYVRGLSKAAIDAGARMFTGSAAISCEDLGRSWRIATAAGSVTATWVIIATDAYSVGPWARLKQEQTMLPYFNMATSPLDDDLRKAILPGGEGVWDSKAILSSFRMDRTGRLIFGSVGALRGTGSAIHRAWARRELARLFPQLKTVSFEQQWYGLIGMTDNALPRLHRHGRAMFSMSGYNGRGIAPGTVFGRDLARLALGEVEPGNLSLPITNLSIANHRTAKSLYYEVGAQAAHLTGSRFQVSALPRGDER